MTLAEILLTLGGIALGLAAAIGVGLGVVVCINYIENIISKHSKS